MKPIFCNCVMLKDKNKLCKATFISQYIAARYVSLPTPSTAFSIVLFRFPGNACIFHMYLLYRCAVSRDLVGRTC